ncbi:hypothetical protein GCM10023185_19540 [Hymenobacter saemangeumensis]|uniref:Uncharacterized protein n=1 Tax=Hymenobacter saemangeumensis TaxID=1084522 RepID=A0ABP8IDD4_9BACT
MLPDNFSGDGTDPNEGEHARITENKDFPQNEQLQREKEYQQDQSNNKASSDPTAARYIGANGYRQRNNQKDQLENLTIHGDDINPGGGNEHHSAGEQAQGPGFEAEGSIELDHELRTREQPFGAKEPTGPARPITGDGTVSNP